MLPGTLRQANTTFVNLRAALDDLDPLVDTSKVATRDLAPFLRKLQPVLHRSVPVFTDLRKVVDLPGPDNDLGESIKALPKVQPKAANAFPAAVEASQDSMPFISFARPYAPDLLGAFTKLGQVTAYYDANGHFARVQPANANLFENRRRHASSRSRPASSSTTSTSGIFARCPGGSTQPIAGSNPFDDNGNLAGACDPIRRPTRAMRRVLATIAIVVACTGLVLAGTAGSDGGGTYEVRAIFDNGGFIVPGEDVRVAGRQRRHRWSRSTSPTRTRRRASKAGPTRSPARRWW